MASGAIHSSGIDAMSCVMWFDTASSSNEPVAASVHHNSWRPGVGGGSDVPVPAVAAAPATLSAVADAFAARRLRCPAAMHKPTKSA